MKLKLRIIAVFLFLPGFYLKAYPDTPLTSINIWEAYRAEKIVMLAGQAEGKLTTELMDYLYEAENPIDVKMAVINRLGWDIDLKDNSGIFFRYLHDKRGYADLPDMMKDGRDYELLCMAYLMAMDNYSELERAVEMSGMAVMKDKTMSFTYMMISALVRAQTMHLEFDWCLSYFITSQVKKNRSLKRDMKREAVRIIFRYMNLYRRYCW